MQPLISDMFNVDDGMVAARTTQEAEDLVRLAGSTIFSILELGEPRDLLGIEVSRDRDAGTITIAQKGKAEALASEFGVARESRAVLMLTDACVFGELRAATEGAVMANREQYQTGIGGLLHLAQCTRSAIALAVGALAAFGSAPTTEHYEAKCDSLRGSYREMGQYIWKVSGPCQDLVFANCAACVDTRGSTTGWVMFGGAVSWGSKKQSTTAASTMEAEYMACGAVAGGCLSL